MLVKVGDKIIYKQWSTNSVKMDKEEYLLKENPNEDAGRIIALLIIERQIQKIKFKKEMSENERDDGGEERL